MDKSNKKFNLNAEEISGHFVSEDIKRLWAVQMDILDQLKTICEKNNIRYFAGGGTLLGAVRHNGFIPWDDDIDVFMLSDDYEKFCAIAEKELKTPYFFQHYTTELGYTPSMARIRRSDTTALTQYEYDTFREGYNYGVFIDIFPLHNVPDNIFMRVLQSLIMNFFKVGIAGYQRKMIKNRLGCFRTDKYLSYFLLFSWNVIGKFISYNKLSEWFMQACSLSKESKYVGLIAFFGFKDKYIWEKSLWANSIVLSFEDRNINCPVGYDSILRKQFGDYMVFQKGTAIHSLACFDTAISYKCKVVDCIDNYEH